MRTMSQTAPRGTRRVSSDGWISLGDSMIDWQDQPADPIKEDALAYSFYALLDDAELREVFGDFTVPAAASD